MEPGDTLHKIIRIEDSAGSGVTGKSISDLTVTGYKRAYGASVWSSWTTSATLTEEGGGLYSLALTLPSSAGFYFAQLIENAGEIVIPALIQDEIEDRDFNAIYGAVARPVITLTGQGTVGQTQPVDLVKNRYRQLVFTFQDDNGAAVDVENDYGNYAAAFRSQDGTTEYFIPTDGGSITASSDTLTVTIPEDASFFALRSDDDLDDVTVYYEVTGDEGGTATKTVSLVQHSPAVLLRREVGA